MKKFIRASMLVVVVICAGVGASGGRALAASCPSGVVTNDCLPALLKDMGYENRALSKGYLITIKGDGWTYYIQLVLSNDATKLGMNANLGTVANEQAVTAAQWMNVLAANNDVDPSSFNYDRVKKKLYLHRALDNHDITSAFLRRQIDLFVQNIRSTDAIWSRVTR